jgi:hypothetical protein
MQAICVRVLPILVKVVDYKLVSTARLAHEVAV